MTLGLGIGANTAIFSLVNSLLLKPLPVPNAEQIATLAPRENNGSLQQTLSWDEYKQVRAQSGSSFSDLFAYTINLDGMAVKGQQPDRILATYVSSNYFAGLGLKPAAGRHHTMNGILLFQVGASLAAIMRGLGLMLAVIGLYGVVSYAVGRRIHEIGLRWR